MVRTCVSSGPLPGSGQGLGILGPGIPGPCCEWPGTCTGGSGTRPRGPGTPVEVLDLARRFGPYVVTPGFEGKPNANHVRAMISNSRTK
jgi:hypothetical protein